MSIQKGSIIDVYFENIEYEYGLEVLYMPQSDGDYFICKRKDGTQVNIQHFCKMVEGNLK